MCGALHDCESTLAISTSVSLKYLKYNLELGIVVVSSAFRRWGDLKPLRDLSPDIF